MVTHDDGLRVVSIRNRGVFVAALVLAIAVEASLQPIQVQLIQAKLIQEQSVRARSCNTNSIRSSLPIHCSPLDRSLNHYTAVYCCEYLSIG